METRSGSLDEVLLEFEKKCNGKQCLTDSTIGRLDKACKFIDDFSNNSNCVGVFVSPEEHIASVSVPCNRFVVRNIVSHGEDPFTIAAKLSDGLSFSPSSNGGIFVTFLFDLEIIDE